MKEKIIKFSQQNLPAASITISATVITPILSCALTGLSLKTFGLSLIGTVLATGSASGATVLDSKFGADLYGKIYSGDNHHIKALVEYGIPSTFSAIPPALYAFIAGKGAIVPVISAIVQTSALKYLETANAFEECFFGEEIGINEDQTPTDQGTNQGDL
jgi:hypothetical protein